MVPVATRSHQAASALLLQASRALSRDYLGLEDVAQSLREAFALTARSYLAQRTLFGGESLDKDAVISDWFALVPRALAKKGATILRKLNFLGYGSPYRPLMEGEADWDTDSIREEFSTIVEEIALLLALDSVGGELPSFRGEADICPQPGSVVTYSLYDWDQWSHARCVVVMSDPPNLLLRFADRHYEEIDTTIALVQPIPNCQIDLNEPFEQRRTQFELILYGDDIGLYDDSYFPPTFGISRAVVTCSCCGYPTRRLQFPAFLHMNNATSGLERCLLCGWDEKPEPIAFAPDGSMDLSEALREARRHAEASKTAFAPEDSSAVALEYRHPLRRAQADRARTLFNGLLLADTPQDRAEIWAATQKILRSLSPRASTQGRPRQGEQRVRIAVQQAFASL